MAGHVDWAMRKEAKRWRLALYWFPHVSQLNPLGSHSQTHAVVCLLGDFKPSYTDSKGLIIPTFLMGIQVVSSSWLWTMLQWSWEYKYLYQISTQLFCIWYPEVVPSYHRGALCLFLRHLHTSPHSRFTILHFCQQVKGLQFLSILSKICYVSMYSSTDIFYDYFCDHPNRCEVIWSYHIVPAGIKLGTFVSQSLGC